MSRGRSLFCWCDNNVQGSHYYMRGLGGGGGGDLMSVFVNPSHDLKTFDCLCPSISWPALLTMCPSTSWLTHLTVFVLIHLMTVLLRITIDCVQTSDDLQTHLTNVFISWPADTFNSVCVLPSHDLRHFWQCLCPSISWPQTLLTVFVSIHLMTSDTFDSVCVHPSHDLQTHLTVCLCPSHDLHTFDNVCVHPSHDLRHFWQCLCPSISWPAHFWQCLCPSSLWPADIFDNVCVHPSHDLHTFDNVCVHPAYDLQTFLTMV